jgi:hypothetical protein
MGQSEGKAAMFFYWERRKEGTLIRANPTPSLDQEIKKDPRTSLASVWQARLFSKDGLNLTIYAHESNPLENKSFHSLNETQPKATVIE